VLLAFSTTTWIAIGSIGTAVGACVTAGLAFSTAARRRARSSSPAALGPTGLGTSCSRRCSPAAHSEAHKAWWDVVLACDHERV
jgi:hypothetical protein